jgi:hypothetical protein
VMIAAGYIKTEDRDWGLFDSLASP